MQALPCSNQETCQRTTHDHHRIGWTSSKNTSHTTILNLKCRQATMSMANPRSYLIRITSTFGLATHSCSSLCQTKLISSFPLSCAFPPDAATFDNQDCTFTCTLFAPTTEFDRLHSPQDILSWFKTHFPDAVSLLGEKQLLFDFTNNPRGSLITIKVDASHPFLVASAKRPFSCTGQAVSL